MAGGGGVPLAARPHVVRRADVPQKLHRVFVLNMTEYRYWEIFKMYVDVSFLSWFNMHRV